MSEHGSDGIKLGVIAMPSGEFYDQILEKIKDKPIEHRAGMRLFVNEFAMTFVGLGSILPDNILDLAIDNWEQAYKGFTDPICLYTILMLNRKNIRDCLVLSFPKVSDFSNAERKMYTSIITIAEHLIAMRVLYLAIVKYNTKQADVVNCKNIDTILQMIDGINNLPEMQDIMYFLIKTDGTSRDELRVIESGTFLYSAFLSESMYQWNGSRDVMYDFLPENLHNKFIEQFTILTSLINMWAMKISEIAKS